MVDNSNPTNQFHPYQPVNDTPNADKAMGFAGMNWQDSLSKARDYAKSNPAVALGALAAIAIGAGLMRGRR
jgi:hypothetical protein